MKAKHGCQGDFDAIMHYEKGCKLSYVKHQLDSDGDCSWLSLFLLKIFKFRRFVNNIFIYAVEYDENGVDKTDDQIGNQTVKSNLLEVLEVIHTYRVSIVGNVASDKKKTRCTYKSSYLINDYLPWLPLLL